MGKLDGRIALITGASRGIGRAIAEKFAREGAKLALAARNVDGLNTVGEACKSAGAQDVKVFGVDVGKSADLEALIKNVTEAFGGLDILVNNAGITRDNLLMRIKEEDWDAVLDTNLKAAFTLTKAASRPLMKSKYGRVINMASVIGITGNAGQANYAASKAGLIALTKSTAKELASRAVTANAIAPGMIETDMTAELSDQVKAEIASRIPLGRQGKADDVANAAAFLASDDAAYVTGQVIVVDGGMVM
ncbi:MAG: 3-oxoacyl-[acyl-carrier-protein] reductase [Planctomycetes bacterium]|nr:3-oxoacyl-[acyl-carrier-protein] reductase [Planctomycetota bacterium]NUQ33467.1 3-oxoacyl-[acyl-carrier-protein] reductase [Planctomycetaceae bacterium]